MPETTDARRLPFPVDPLAIRPEVEAAEAERTAAELWGLRVRATPLPGERDRNFLLEDPDGGRYVLKVSSASEKESLLDLQHSILRYARERDPGLRLPAIVPLETGADRAARQFAGREHAVRLLRYTEGRALSAFRRRPPALLDAVGRLTGRLQRALAGFDHPGLDQQTIPWAPEQAGEVIRAASEILPKGERRDLYRRLADTFGSDRERLRALPAGALHNDANDDNLLLAAETPETAGAGDLALLDFGDAVRGPPILEAATAAMYVSIATAEPLRAAALVLAGFAAEHPVSEIEADLFRAALGQRALVSAGVAALRRELVPGAGGEAYLMTSEIGVWRFLGELAAEAPEPTGGRFRLAAGHTFIGAAPTGGALRRAAAGALPPIPLAAGFRVLDLTPGNPELDPADPVPSLTQAVAAATAGGRQAVGRYREPRFAEFSADEDAALGEPATIQLGIEVFAAPGTPVRAPLDGEVAWAEDGSLGLRHETEGAVFWTAYRNLEPTAPGVTSPPGQFRRGEVLGRISATGGPDSEPDCGPPHLHFQLLLGEFSGRPPRRTSLRDLPVLAAWCPDPSGFFGLDSTAVCPEETLRGAPELEKARARRISRALSVSYDLPIQLVRGRGARLYDPAGRDYLDMVNNVCHVGHAHPRVAEAIARQARLLNTNTRYLYRQLTDYADRLTATLPPPLEVVFLTNSGSEANDLALRLARARLGGNTTLVFDGGYHGNLTSLIEVSPYKLDGAGGRPSPPWLHRLPMPDGFRGKFRAEEPGFPAALVADAAERVRRAGPATLVAEAILSCGGQIVPPPGYLRALYRAVRDAGGVVVADEVQTGFGRTGPAFWAFLAVQEGEPPESPDIVTLGKPAGNGHPLGAVVTTREIARSFETGMEYFNTFGGNPVSCAAGLAVLDVIREERLAEHAHAIGGRLLDGLKQLANRYPLLGEVRGRGLFLGFEMVRDRTSREPASEEARRLVNRLREFRILNSTDGPDANVIKLKPPLVFSADDADHYLEILETVLEEQF